MAETAANAGAQVQTFYVRRQPIDVQRAWAARRSAAWPRLVFECGYRHMTSASGRQKNMLIELAVYRHDGWRTRVLMQTWPKCSARIARRAPDEWPPGVGAHLHPWRKGVLRMRQS